MRDLASNIVARVAIAPAVVADNTTATGAIIDRLGFESVTYVVATGTLADADATFAVTMTHGDSADLSDGAAVTDADLVGTLAGAGFTFAADNATRKLGYVGPRRYTRLTITPTGNSGNAPLAAVAILSHANTRPVA